MIENRLKKLRETHSLSQRKFAEKVGVSYRSWQNYEKDASALSIKMLKNIASICDINEAWLLTGEGEASQSKESNIEPIDPAVQILDEAEKETGIKLNPKQRQKVARILREELKKKEKESKDNIITMMKAFKE